MDAEQLERIRSARNNFERIATQGSSDAGIMEVIITHLPPELRQRTIEFAEHLRSVSDGAAELVIQLDQVNGVGSRVPGNVKKGAMHAATRTYSGKGAVELIDFIEKNKAEVERLIRSIDGFASFTLVRTGSGGFTVSVFQDKTGTDESIRVAREWISQNAGQIGVAPPTVVEGTVILQSSVGSGKTSLLKT
jgi:hypothetical protein